MDVEPPAADEPPVPPVIALPPVDEPLMLPLDEDPEPPEDEVAPLRVVAGPATSRMFEKAEYRPALL
jgi:hypothetical protein